MHVTEEKKKDLIDPDISNKIIEVFHRHRHRRQICTIMECTLFVYHFHGFYMFFYRKTGGNGKRTERTPIMGKASSFCTLGNS